MDYEQARSLSQAVVVRALSLAVVLGFGSRPVTAQTVVEAAPDRVEQSIYTRSEHPVLFDAVKLRTSDLLEAAISVEDKAGKVVYAPLLYGLPKYITWLSELRLQISQKDNQASAGLGTVYNQASPRSRRGKALWEQTKDECDEQSTDPEERCFAVEVLKLKGAQAAVSERIEELASRIHQAPTTTLEEKVQLAVLGRDLLALSTERARLETQSAALEAKENERIKNRILSYDEALVATPVPVVGITYGATLFQLLGGSAVDGDNDGLEDNARKLRRHSVGLTAEVRPSLRWMVSAVGVIDWERPSAEADVIFAKVYGFGATVGGIAMVLNKDYRKTDDYRASLFIPSVVIGGAFEGRWCQEEAALCPDLKRSETAVTPFIDLKVAKSAQFRLGFPLKRVATGTASRTELAAVTSFSLQLGQPK